jgi:hypothetical protein
MQKNMSGREKIEDGFEKEWREAFEGVTQTPPRIIWSEIDRSLANDRAVVFQKKVVYYKWAAIAAILFLAMTAVFRFTDSQSNDNLELADNQMIIKSKMIIDDECGDSQADYSITKNKKSTISNSEPPTNNGRNVALASSSGYSNENFQAPTNQYITDEVYEAEDWTVKKVNKVSFDGLEEDKRVALVDELYKVASTYLQVKKQKQPSTDQKYWAGIDVSSGTFDPNFQNGTGGIINNSLDFSPSAKYSAFNTEKIDQNSPSVKESMASGQTKSLGFNFGLKVHPRWLLQSGFQYMRADAVNNTNMIVSSSRLLDPIAVTSQIKGVAPVRSAVNSEQVVEYDLQDVKLENQFQFATIPLKAGYLLIDDRLSVMVNAGVAANLYLGNKLSDPNNELANVSIGPGANSPYKDLSFVGLAGVQFGYQLIKRFDLILEPNYRQSLNELSKSSSDFVASPSGFGLQTGLRYRFN